MMFGKSLTIAANRRLIVNSNTPRTDAVASYMGTDERLHHDKRYPTICNLVTADFSRQLERELNEANEKIKQLEADKVRLDWLETQDCWIGVYGEYEINTRLAVGGNYCESVRAGVDKAMKCQST